MIAAPHPAPSSVASGVSRPRSPSILLIVMMLSFLVPVALTFIPRPGTIADTRPYASSNCYDCQGGSDCFPYSYSVCGSGAAKMCCPIKLGLFETARCGLSGDTCYQPVLVNVGLMLCMVVMVPVWALLWCLKWCCEREEQQSRVAEQHQQPHVQLEYVRMAE
jgi:hypothetical protein